MKYLSAYNEEIKWLRRASKVITGPKKSDMYISEKFPGPTVADITPDILMSGKKVPDTSVNLLKDYYIKDISNKGVFVHTPHDYSHSQYKFKDKFNDATEVWYNQSYIFTRLKDISNQLGYKVGTYVDTNNGGSGFIEKIVKFAFYDIGRGCNEVLTLLYKVGDTYYQITQIEKSNGPGDNIIDDVIKENFYDLIDDNIITYTSIDKGTLFDCKIIIHESSITRLHQVTESLSVAENRLKDSNIILDIEDISKVDGEYVIEFKCIKKRK